MGKVARMIPRRFPLVGNLPRYLADKLGFLRESVREYGLPVEMQLGGRTLLLTDPADVHHVLVENPTNYSKTPRLSSPRGKKLFGEGLLTTSSSEHLRQRRLLQPVFTNSSIRNYGDVVKNQVLKAVEKISTRSQVDLCLEMEELTRSVLVAVLFGEDFEDSDGEFAVAVRDHREFIEYVYASLLPYPERWYLPIVRREKFAQKLFAATIEAQIKKCRESGNARRSLLQDFLNANYADGSSMSDSLVFDEAVTMLSTGYETIGDALTWAYYLLCKNPAVVQRMKEEVERVLGGRSPDADDIVKLTYVNQVFSESLRIYSPTWIFVRVANGQDRLPSGFPIYPGTKIYLSQYISHRDPRWFPDPERFDPDRFAPQEVEKRPRFSYFPFGGGARVCIGEHLARMEAVMVLATTVQRLRFELVYPEEPVLKPGITLRPRGGLLVRVF